MALLALPAGWDSSKLAFAIELSTSGSPERLADAPSNVTIGGQTFSASRGLKVDRPPGLGPKSKPVPIELIGEVWASWSERPVDRNVLFYMLGGAAIVGPYRLAVLSAERKDGERLVLSVGYRLPKAKPVYMSKSSRKSIDPTDTGARYLGNPINKNWGA